MPFRFSRIMTLCSLLLVAVTWPRPAQAQSADDGKPDQVLLSVGAGSPSLQPNSSTYLSTPTAAARPFTHMLLRWEASVPTDATLSLAVRASVDNQTWTDWAAVTENDDLWVEADGPDVHWSQTIDAGRMRFWQVRAEWMPGPDGTQPALRGIQVNTVDADAFAPAQPVTAPRSAPSNVNIAKPPVVSRTAWGCPDGQGSRVKPAYYPVNHITVHHTADSSTLLPGEADWAARVRAEWSFHTYTRGWGDIGYNYLIDPNGVIYEGRAGGDDAVGFHDTANYGSMGVVIIGTYSDYPPSASSQNSLVTLMAWKSSQKRIDPLGKSYYYGCALSKYCYPYNPGAVVLNIAAHRQVTPGHTTCPGDSFAALLPTLRNRVKQMISGSPTDNGDLEIDELETSFARSNANWYEASCGAGGHTYYTYTTDNPAESTNSATWRPNIPTTGIYRVYAYIPQGCGLGTPPYASTRATYRIHSADGDFERVVDHNTDEEWVDLGRYTFAAGTGGAVELFDLTGEPYSAKRVLFFDALKWVPESDDTNVVLVSTIYDRTTIAAGELLRVAFTIKNTGKTTLYSQDPQIDPTAGGGSLDDGYVYDQDECFLGDAQGSYPAYPKMTGRFRLTLGPTNTSSINCVDNPGNYPWRWGLNTPLEPGQQQTVIGYVRFRTPGTYRLQAGIIQEYVKYYVENANPVDITVTPEKVTPDTASFSAMLQPAAQVYRLGAIPDNFLARTRNPLSIPRGEYVGSFAWNGNFVDWGNGGPLNLSDSFVIEQTRMFNAPTTGDYTFLTTSDDGSWLWVDGQPVIVNYGLHAPIDITGTIRLEAGTHILSFKYFERGGPASVGYAVQYPASGGVNAQNGSFRVLTDGLGDGTLRVGATLQAPVDVVLSGDDLGGVGVALLRWNVNDTGWHETPGALLKIGKENFGNASYRIQYFAVDKNGNQGSQQELAFTIDPNLELLHTFLPLTQR